MSVLRHGVLLTLLAVLACVDCESRGIKPATVKVRPSLTKNRIRRGRTSNAMSKAKTQVEGQGVCTWDTEIHACRLSHASAAEKLRQSDNAYAQFIAHYAACSAAKSEDACEANEKCTWTGDAGCRFVEFTVGHEDSPCVKDAKSYFKGYIASETCTLHTTQLTCLLDRDCEWDDSEEEHYCDSADMRFHVGASIDEILTMADAVVDYKVTQLLKVFHTTFAVGDPDFNWTAIVEWKAPQTDCPEWSDPLFCAYSDGDLTEAGPDLYCIKKYGRIHQIEECIEDPQCQFDMSGFQCRAEPKVFRRALYKGLQALIPFMSGKSFRKAATWLLGCNVIVDKENCIGKCVWEGVDEDNGSCELPGTWIAKAIAESWEEGPDPICNLVTVWAGSECWDIDDDDKCLENSSCMFDLAGDCTVSVEYLIASALEKDESLKRSYDLSNKECLTHKTQAVCEASTVAPSVAVV